jgi:hypothetical protein
MLLLTTLLIILSLTGITALVGLAVANLLPYRLKPVGRLFFSPLFGLAVFILVATINGWLMPFNQWVSLAELFVATAVSLYLLRKNTKPFPWLKYFSVLSLFSLIASTPVLAPLIHFDGYTSFNDAFTYLIHGQWLQKHAYSETAVGSGYYPYLAQVISYQASGSRMGASFFLGWVQSLYGLKWSYFAYPAAISIPLVAGALATGGAVSLIVRRSSKNIALLTALAAATLFNGFMYGTTKGFYPQTFGLAFIIGAMTLFAGTMGKEFSAGIRVSDPKNSKLGLSLQTGKIRTDYFLNLFKSAIPISLLFAAFIFCYNDMMPFIVAAIIGFFILIGIFNREKLKLKGAISLHAMVLLQTVILSNFEFIRVARNAIGILVGVGSGVAQIGWPVLWNPIGFLAFPFGFRLAYGPGYWVLGQKLTPIVFLIFFAALLYFIFHSLKRKPSPYLLVQISVLSVFFLAFIYFRYFVDPVTKAETGHTFLQFKIAKWSSLFCVSLMGSAIAFYMRKLRTKIPMFLLSLFVFASIAVNMVIIPKNITQNFLSETGYGYAPFSSFLKLRDIVKDIPPDDVIYLKFGFEHYPLRQMAVYVLHDRKLASDYSDDGAIRGWLHPEDRIMPFNIASWVIEYGEPGKKYVKPKVGNLGLMRASDFHDELYLSSVKEGYNRETDGKDLWYWTPKSLIFEFKRLEGMNRARKARLKFSYASTTSVRNLSVEVAGRKLTKFNIKMDKSLREYESEPIDVRGDNIIIKFASDGEPIRLSDTDVRMASYQIKNFKIEPILLSPKLDQTETTGTKR